MLTWICAEIYHSRRDTPQNDLFLPGRCLLEVKGGPGGIASGCGLDDRAICRTKNFSLLQIFQTASGALSAPYSVGTGDLSRGVKRPGCQITTNLHLVTMFRMVGAKSPFLLVPSCFSQEQLYFCLSR